MIIPTSSHPTTAGCFDKCILNPVHFITRLLQLPEAARRSVRPRQAAEQAGERGTRMAHLWIEGPDGKWAATTLGDRHVVGTPQRGRAPLIVRSRSGHVDRWVLITPSRSRATVNGGPVSGVRALDDRDDVFAAPGHRFYFSTDEPARIEPFAGRPDTLCPRCSLPIEPGSPAVRCPNPDCRVCHHENDQRQCWTRRSTCMLCGEPTALDGRYRWTPGEL